MEKETKSSLNDLIDKHELKLEESRRKKEQIKSEEDSFLREFERLRKEVIRPVMEDIGSHLRGRGNDYQIHEEEESVDSSGRTLDARIIMRIFPKGVDRSEYRSWNSPSVSFIATRYKKKMWIHGNNIMPGRSGSAGSRGELAAEEITNEVVERKILEVLKEIFDPKW